MDESRSKPTNRERLREITDSIESGIQSLFASDKFADYLRTMGKFHQYSVNNTLLIYMQRPDATRVASFNKWRDAFGRNVKKGEKGIKIIAPAFFRKKVEEMKLDPDTRLPMTDANGEVIMQTTEVKIPMYKVVTVFDLSQTEGRPLPTLAETLTGDVQQYDVFMEALRRSAPVPMEFAAMQPSMDGYFSQSDQKIVLREGMSEVQTVCAAIHETAHAKLHNRLMVSDAEYRRGTLFDRPVLFTDAKINRDKLPLGLHAYDLRSRPEAPDIPAMLEPKVLSNFAGSVITDMSLTMPEKGFIDVADRLTLEDDRVTMRAYYAEVLPEMANKNNRTQEVEAESIAYSVAAYYGIDTGSNSLGYIASWSSDKQLPELRASLETITATASRLITDIDRHFAAICKERGLDRTAEPTAERPGEALFLVDDSLYLRIRQKPDDINYDYALYTADSLKRMDAGETILPEDSVLIGAPFVQVAEDLLREIGVGYSALQHQPPDRLAEIDAANAVTAQTVQVNDGTYEDKSPPDRSEKLEKTPEAEPEKPEATEPVKTEENPEKTAEPEKPEAEEPVKTPPEAHAEAPAQPDEIPAAAMPEPAISLDAYPRPNEAMPEDILVVNGYDNADLLPVSREQAHELMEQDFTIYSVGADGEAVVCMEHGEIDEAGQNGVAAILRDEWEMSEPFRARIADRLDRQEEREAAFAAHPGDSMAIYQLGASPEARERLFMDAGWLEKNGMTPDKSMYDLIYTAPLNDRSLEDIFYDFNMNRPADFGGHSLSASDVVAVNRGGEISFHYCDRVGFRELSDFGESYLKTAEMSVEDDLNMLDGIINNGPKNSAAEAVKNEDRRPGEAKAGRVPIHEQLRRPTPPAAEKTAPKKGAERDAI